MCIEVKPGKEFARIRDPTRQCFGIEARTGGDACANRFHQVEKLPPTDLSLFVASQQERFAFAYAPMPFALPAALRCAAVQRLVLAIELVDVLVANKSSRGVERRPLFMVQAGKSQRRPRLALRVPGSEEMDARVRMRAEIVALQARRAEKFPQPSQIRTCQQFTRQQIPPSAAEPLELIPMCSPTEL